MASAPSEPRPVLGRVDKAGRLVSADPELEALQREAGSRVGQTLALPQIAAIAELARKLGTPVARPAIAAALERDIELWVRAVPEGDEVALSLDGWTERAPAGPRLASLLGRGAEVDASAERQEWAADEELRLISIAPDLAKDLGIDIAEAAGQPLTRLFRLEEDEAGEMPLISALAARRGFSGQRARSRSDESKSVVLSGEVVTGADGSFAGFRGAAQTERAAVLSPESTRTSAFDAALDEALRSPLDRIIESAERIVERADGPLRSDYASYGNDIAAAARHLLSVIRSMSEDPTQDQRTIDLAALSGEALVMLESTAEDRRIVFEVETRDTLPASGEERAVIQILVNLIGNAVRHSPEGGTVRLAFAATPGTASVTVTDEGPGIDHADQQRIFERFERADTRGGGTGLGLAISRRLARSMGGDVSLESAPGEGARFTLTLPAA
ncbi:MAG TPA: HAMP domain-containing sensor histidine kinase [Sphingomicrobium sp.]|nr:HAMP domain-containing sensor histidine kinase [Sphingomicrobium sp.]